MKSVVNKCIFESQTVCGSLLAAFGLCCPSPTDLALNGCTNDFSAGEYCCKARYNAREIKVG